MASIINASTSGAGGVITTADASGELQLQSGGNAVVSFTNTGGTAPRITGDFGSPNRVAFQTNIPDSGTIVDFIPNGTSLAAGIRLYGSSDITNAPLLQINPSFAGNAMIINSSFTGTGSLLPINIQFAGTVRARFETNGDFQMNSGYGSVATAYGCRAWVNFDGTGTVAIRASGNVSSITDNGTGNYTVNFTTAMPNANYSAVCITSTTTGSAGNVGTNNQSVSAQTYATSSFTVTVGDNNSDGSQDAAIVNVSVFR
jgi:hypothetical protein